MYLLRIAFNKKPILPETRQVLKKVTGRSVYHFKLVPVTTGLSEGGYTEVRLPENSHAEGKIVTKGAYDLLSKMKNSEEE